MTENERIDTQFVPDLQLWTKVLFLRAIIERRVPMKVACEAFGISLACGYHWRSEYLTKGAASIPDKRFGPREQTKAKMHGEPKAEPQSSWPEIDSDVEDTCPR